jgi:xanthine dehydrogenase accessory factor
MTFRDRIESALEAHGTCVLVTIAAVEGSAPREAGASMLVTPRGFHGTIGGGTLEWQALARAQAQLGRPAQAVETSHALGPELGQCCGGRVKLRMEVLDRSSLPLAGSAQEHRRPLYLFGAGHVGRALVLALAPLPFDVTWVDPRDGAFPPVAPENVELVRSESPARELARAPEGGFVLAMTHSHSLDLEIVDAALRAGRFPYIGLIGSATKRARFGRQLRDGGIPERSLAGLTCPIGVPGVRSKHPAAIAATTVVQLLERDEMLKTGALPVAAAAVSDRRIAGKGA